MCGRFQSTSSPDEVGRHFAVESIDVEGHRPSWNVAPSSRVLAVLEDERERRLQQLRWGFVPAWAKKVGGRGQPNNARVETVATSRMFASSFRSRRCIIPADGFYEWQARDDGRPKQPFHLAATDRAPLAFAAIWTTWHDPDGGDDVISAAIVTTAARGAMERIHHRMPVILPSTLWSSWLSATPDDAPHLVEVVAALTPSLTATPISTRVNQVRNNGPELLEPATVG